jgi:EmrB/QacA subfamily drug resistance transporter
MNKRTLTLIATILGSGMVVLDGFVVNLALPSIGRDLHAGFSDLQWVIDGFLLSLSSLILIGGSLGDILGRKKIYIIGLIGFTAVSVLCAVSPSAGFLIGARFLQGIFGALLVPGGLAIINTNFPKAERGRAIGRWSAWMAMVVPIGPLLGGYIISVSSWRWIFLINVPLGIVCWLLARSSFVESHSGHDRHIDVRGAVLATLMLAGITYGLIEGPPSHWSAASLAAIGAGIILAAGFFWSEKSRPDPMVQLGLFKSRNFSGSNIMTFAMYGALSGFTFILPIYLQTRLGYSAFIAGLALLPISVLLLLFSSRMGALSARVGPRYFMAAGPLVVALSMWLLASYKPGDSFLTFLIPRTILFGIGMALFVAPLTATVMSSVPETSSGIASGINNAVTRVGSLLVIALLGVAGTGDTYRFSAFFCAVLAAAAGIVSWLIIQNPAKPQPADVS